MVDLFDEDTLNESSSSEKKSIEAVKFETDNQPLFKQVERVIGQGEKKGVDAKGIFINFLKNGGFAIDESGVPFPLLDGTEAVFDLVVVEPDKIEELTDVHPSNERDPDALTAESLQDIIPTLSKKGNLYPAIANKNPDSGKLEFMDGSRRRMSCIIDKKPLRVYVARESISLADAQYISKVSRKQKAHSYYELGLRHLKEFNRLDSEGGRLYPDKKDLAAYLFGDNYTDSDYQTLLLQLKFAEIPQSLISVVPDYNGLSVSKYNEVAKVFKTIQAHSISKSLPIEDVISGYLKKIDALVLVVSQDTKLGTKKKQSGIIKILKENWAEFSEADAEPKKVTTPLKKFNDRNKVARKVETKHFTHFEFKRISDDKIQKIEDFILEQLQDEE